MRGLIVEANQQPELFNVFSTFAADTPQLYLDLDRKKAQTLGRPDQRRVHRAPGHAGRSVHQRLQPVRPHLAGQHPGRPGLPQGGRRHLQGPRAQCAGRDGADPLARLGAPGARAVGPDPLQPLPQRHRQRLGGAGLQHGRCARRDGAAVGDHPAGRLRLRVDRHRAAGEGGGRSDHGGSRARAPVRVPVPGRALRELEHPDPGAAVGQRRRARGDRRDHPRRPELRHLRPDRPRRADRARRQERDPDRRVRDRAAPARQVDRRIPRSRAQGCASAR